MKNKTNIPATVYHGSLNKFARFSVTQDIGFHFGNRTQAENLIEAKGNNGQQAYIYHCKLNIKNPLVYGDIGFWYYPNVILNSFVKNDVITETEAQAIRNLKHKSGHLLANAQFAAIKTLLKTKGYDGIIYDNTFEGPGKSYIAFSPSQISIKKVEQYSVTGTLQGDAQKFKEFEFHSTKEYKNPKTLLSAIKKVCAKYEPYFYINDALTTVEDGETWEEMILKNGSIDINQDWGEGQRFILFADTSWGLYVFMRVLNGKMGKISGPEKQPWEMTLSEWHDPKNHVGYNEIVNFLPNVSVEKVFAIGKFIKEFKQPSYSEIQKLPQKEKDKTNELFKTCKYSKYGTIDFERHHLNQVKQAISEGKPVPPEVLADYPQLAKAKQPVTNAKPAKNQHELNQQIAEFIKAKDSKAEAYTDDERNYVNRYEGSGGQIKHGAKGEGVLYEFFTPDYISEIMYKLALTYGYIPGQNVLEPSSGTGRLLIPFTDKSSLTAFEINPVSARICEINNPGCKVYNHYFETAFLQPDRFTSRIKKELTWLPGYPFSLVTGNPPYGKYANLYSSYFKIPKLHQIEQFFFYYALKLLKPGGLLIYLVSSNFLRNGISYNSAKVEIGKLATMLDAYRLPSVFKFSDVPTDIIVLQKNQQK